MIPGRHPESSEGVRASPSTMRKIDAVAHSLSRPVLSQTSALSKPAAEAARSSAAFSDQLVDLIPVIGERSFRTCWLRVIRVDEGLGARAEIETMHSGEPPR